MSKLLKVTLEFEDKVLTVEGSEAEKWDSHNMHVASFAEVHNFNPFTNDPIKWEEVNKEDLPKVSLGSGNLKVTTTFDLKNSTDTVFNGSVENPVFQQTGESTTPEKTMVTSEGKSDDSTSENFTSQEQPKKKGPKGKQS